MAAPPTIPPATGRSTQPTLSIRPPLPGSLSANTSMGNSSMATRNTSVDATKANAGAGVSRSDRAATMEAMATVT